MSTFAQFRTSWGTWVAAVLPGVPASWALDPQAMLLKLPVRVELEGPHTIQPTSDRDELLYTDDGEPVIRAFRTAIVTVRAISRNHVESPAELTLERVRAGLRRPDLRALLADISVLTVGPTVRYVVVTDGRQESVAALEVRLGWRWDDAELTGPSYGVIEQVSGEYDVGGGDTPWSVDGSS